MAVLEFVPLVEVVEELVLLVVELVDELEVRLLIKVDGETPPEPW